MAPEMPAAPALAPSAVPVVEAAAALEAAAQPLPPAAESAGAALEPEIGDSIMVLKQPWLGHILRGQKTLEIRSRKHKTGMVWLAQGGQIYGRCNIEAAEELTIEEFRALEHQHLWPADQDPPYKPRLCGLQLADVHVLAEPVPYWRPRSAIGWHLFRREESDLPMKTAQKKRKPEQEEEEEEVADEATASLH